jgi:hypothetical protein
MYQQYRRYPADHWQQQQSQIVEVPNASFFWKNATNPGSPMSLVNEIPPLCHISATASDAIVHASLYVLYSQNGISLYWHNVPLTRGVRNRRPPCTPPTIEIPWGLTSSTACPLVPNIKANFDRSTGEAPRSYDIVTLHANSQTAHTKPLDGPVSTPSLPVRLVFFVPYLRVVKDTVVGDD